jgi:hypothetical protein
MVPAHQIGIACSWMGVTNCHWPLTPATPPPVRDARVPLTPSEREEAGRKLAGIPANTAQQLLDELAARIAANGIQATPLAYLRGLITRARAGTFTPEGALRVAEHRKCRAEVDAAVRRNEARYHDCPPVAVDTDNPLIKKLLRMQSRSREKESK